MNYIKQINEFYFKIDLEPISVNARSLWHTLTDINNKLCWREEFTVAASKLCDKAGLTDSCFKRARKELEENGYIIVTSRAGNQSALYQMVRLYETVSDSEQQEERNVNHKVDHNLAPLIKQKSKQNNTATTIDAIAFFQDNFGAMIPYVANDIIQWVTDLGEPLVLHAMKRALEQGKGNWGYVKGILQAWAKKGISGVEAAQAEEVEFRAGSVQKKRSYSGGASASASAEVVPEWFTEQKRKRELERKQVAIEEVEMDPAAEMEEMERLLAACRR
ncbi:DnaD domain-containing protein [Virgibacillus flavescens]|uniref:DnaD domain-containing protein n=1 Tax=Virgibacillus flavescens TaxID=1611422 RepID=UPI003D339A51